MALAPHITYTTKTAELRKELRENPRMTNRQFSTRFAEIENEYAQALRSQHLNDNVNNEAANHVFHAANKLAEESEGMDVDSAYAFLAGLVNTIV